jgi:A/G-specific adenine glycosylase
MPLLPKRRTFLEMRSSINYSRRRSGGPPPHPKRWVYKLLKWFRTNGKHYPFRETSDPYRILVAGVMLRQTTARQVSLVYGGFLQKYPTPAALARASLEELRETIRPLGIRKRASNLKRIGTILMATFDGLVPSMTDELLKLPGVGPYIAGCVFTIGFHKPAPMIDVNVERVLSRIYGIDREKNTYPSLTRLYNQLSPKDMERDFHFSLIDLAHAYCRASNPTCGLCPIKSQCCYRGRLARGHETE